MAYLSPFDVLIDISATPKQDLAYNGTLDDVLSEIATLSPHQIITPVTAKIWALHPPRIIRAAVDYKIQHPYTPEIDVLVREAINTSLGIYSDPINSAKTVNELRNKTKTMGLEVLLINRLNQLDDEATWNATHPRWSQITALRIASLKQANGVLFIALAHGSVAAGMDAYLRYCDYSGSRNSTFYVARLSTRKHKDRQPRLSASEVDYLRKIAKDKPVVIFDEDRSSGLTLEIADDYFSDLFPNQSVFKLCNEIFCDENLAKVDLRKKEVELDIYYNVPHYKQLRFNFYKENSHKMTLKYLFSEEVQAFFKTIKTTI